MGIWVIALISILLTKDLIKKRFDRGGKFLFFKSDIVLWKTIGFIGLGTALLRIILLIVFNYPLKWEIIPLHLCRLLSVVVFTILATGKVEKLKHLTYLGVIGSFFAFMFLNEHSEMINEMGKNKNWNISDYINGSNGFDVPHNGYHPTNQEKIMAENHVSVYSAGFDMWLTYDFLIVHVSILLFPFIVRSAYSIKITNKEFIINSILFPALILLLLWLINIATSYIPDKSWRSNYWFIGTDANNDNNRALGILSGWPQNIFTMSALGFILITGQHFIWMAINKLHFFTNGKFIRVEKSQAYNDFKIEWKNWWSKSRFNLKK